MRGGAPRFLGELPAELLERCLVDVSAVLSVSATCTQLHGQLRAATKEAQERRLRWVLPTRERNCDTISADGRTLTRTEKLTREVLGSPMLCWAAAAKPILPVAVRSSFSVRVDNAHDNQGNLLVGVCDSQLRFGWGLDLTQMKLYTWTSNRADGGGRIEFHNRPPEGYPDGRDLVLGTSSGGAGAEECSLMGRVNRSIIEVIIDYPSGGTGTLAFGITTEHPHTRACMSYNCPPLLAGFPRDARLKPWVSLNNSEDRVTLLDRWI